MSRFSKGMVLVLMLLMTVLFVLPAVAATENFDLKVKVDGQLLSFPRQGPVRDTWSGVDFIPLRAVSESMGAVVSWNQEKKSINISSPKRNIILKLNSDQAMVNGKLLIKETGSRLINGHTMVPLYFIAEAWGVKFEWDENRDTVNIISDMGKEPERIYQSSVPAQMAFNSNGSLYLLNSSKAGAEPIKIDTTGQVEIVGWSPDGKWLMYMEEYICNSCSRIWVVSSEGKNKYQIDERPVDVSPAWAPQADIIAYTNCVEGREYSSDGNLKLASLESDEPEITTLLPDKSVIINDIDWNSDGKSLMVACAAHEKDAGLIKRVNLKGECSTLCTVDQADLTDKGSFSFYTWEAKKMKRSPDGRYLACYFETRLAASRSVDGAGIYLLDLEEKPVKVQELGGGLHYKGWLAWSPDSTRLAYIEGSGREATINKKLHIVDVKNGGEISDCSKSGQADTQPLWMPDSSAVLFCRGKDTVDWLGNAGERILIHGQCICSYKNGGKVQLLTAGGENTADYAPNISSDGSNLIFMRLEHNDRGSIYYKDLNENKEMELIKGISGDCGYYGNYYPDWISVYWK